MCASAVSAANLTLLRNASEPVNISASPNALQTYTVYPRKPGTTTRVREVIESIVLPEYVTLVKSQRRQDFDGVLFWSVKLDGQSTSFLNLVARVGNDVSHVVFKARSINANFVQQAQIVPKNVRAEPQKVITPHANYTIRPFKDHSTTKLQLPDIAHQANAPLDLKVVSWVSGSSLLDQLSYTYIDSVKRDTYIYVIDQGLDPEYPVRYHSNYNHDILELTFPKDFRMMPNNEVSWHWPEFAGRSKMPTDSGGGHGSCVASKAAGWINGVSKSSQLIMLKINYTDDEVNWAFNKVWEDITKNRRSGKSVVVFPAAWPPTFDFSGFNDVRQTIQELFDINAVVVVPSGNYGDEKGRQDVDTLPGLWESKYFPLIVVGAVDDNGNIPTFSQGGSHVTTWAPGVQLSCSGHDRPGTSHGSGTSFSTPMVSKVLPLLREQIC